MPSRKPRRRAPVVHSDRAAVSWVPLRRNHRRAGNPVHGDFPPPTLAGRDPQASSWQPRLRGFPATGGLSGQPFEGWSLRGIPLLHPAERVSTRFSVDRASPLKRRPDPPIPSRTLAGRWPRPGFLRRPRSASPRRFVAPSRSRSLTRSVNGRLLIPSDRPGRYSPEVRAMNRPASNRRSPFTRRNHDVPTRDTTKKKYEPNEAIFDECLAKTSAADRAGAAISSPPTWPAAPPCGFPLPADCGPPQTGGTITDLHTESWISLHSVDHRKPVEAVEAEKAGKGR